MTGAAISPPDPDMRDDVRDEAVSGEPGCVVMGKLSQNQKKRKGDITQL